MQGKDGDLWPRVETEPPAITNTFIDVQVAVRKLEQARCVTASIAGKHETPQPRPIDLSAVGVPSKNQITTVWLEEFHSPRIMSKDQTRCGRTRLGKGRMRIYRTTPQIIETCHQEPRTSAVHCHSLVPQYLNSRMS